MGNFIMIPEDEYHGLKSQVDEIHKYIEFLKKSDDRLITIEELLQHIPVSRRNLQNYRDRKVIRFVKKGRKILYSLNDVLDDLKNGRQS